MRAEHVPVARLEREHAEFLAAIAERLRDRFDAGVVGGTDGHAEHHDAVLGIGALLVVHRAHCVSELRLDRAHPSIPVDQRFVERHLVHRHGGSCGLLVRGVELHARHDGEQVGALAREVSVMEHALAAQRALEGRPALHLLRAELALQVGHELVEHLALLVAPGVHRLHDLLEDRVGIRRIRALRILRFGLHAVLHGLDAGVEPGHVVLEERFHHGALPLLEPERRGHQRQVALQDVRDERLGEAGASAELRMCRCGRRDGGDHGNRGDEGPHARCEHGERCVERSEHRGASPGRCGEAAFSHAAGCWIDRPNAPYGAICQWIGAL